MPNETSPRMDLPALVPAPGGAVVCAGDGSCRHLALREARGLFHTGDVLVAHAAFVAGRLKTQPAAALFDVLELFVFVRPGQPWVSRAVSDWNCRTPPKILRVCCAKPRSNC